MGNVNKLLASINGVPMVRWVADQVCASRVRRVVAVTGHQSAAVERALLGSAVTCVHNAQHEDGLAGSLRVGLTALGDECDGAVICLGDMPEITADHLNRLIAAFDPHGAQICVPVSQGRRGNPVLWDRSFFAAMMALHGDRGAKGLMETHADRVVEVDMGDDAAVLRDVDRPEDLGAFRATDKP